MRWKARWKAVRRVAETDRTLFWLFVGKMRRNPESPHLSILDERECKRISTEYKGRKSKTEEDKMCVVLRMKRIPYDEAAAQKFTTAVLGDLKMGTE